MSVSPLSSRRWYVAGSAPSDKPGEFINPVDIEMIPGKDADGVFTLRNLEDTDRIAEAVRGRPEAWDLVVNLQGDEPLLPAENIDALLAAARDWSPA